MALVPKKELEKKLKIVLWNMKTQEMLKMEVAWKVVCVVVPLLLGLGMTAGLTRPEFGAARFCFISSALVLGVMSFWWQIGTDRPLWFRLFVGISIWTLSGAGLAETLRWLSEREKWSLAQQDKKFDGNSLDDISSEIKKLIDQKVKEKIESFPPTKTPPFIATHVVLETYVLLNVSFTRDEATDGVINCIVTDPDNQIYSTFGMGFVGSVVGAKKTLNYPFSGAPPLRPGKYHVVWQWAADNQAIATDEFEFP